MSERLKTILLTAVITACIVGMLATILFYRMGGVH